MVAPSKPANLREALELRAEGLLPLAGGTDLLVRFRAKNGLPPSVPGPVMFVDAIPELRELKFDGEDLVIGASVPLAVIADDPGARAACIESGAAGPEAAEAIPHLLRAAAEDLGAPGLRNRATLAGNLANASPAADTAAALHALEADVELASLSGRRRVPAADFITGPGRTVLRSDELITAVRIRKATNALWQYWRKVGTRRANALTKVSLAAAVHAPAGRIESAALAYGAVGPTVMRPAEAEALLRNRTGPDIDEELAEKIAAAVGKCITPIDDQRSTAHYRRITAMNLAIAALEGLAEHLKDKQK